MKKLRKVFLVDDDETSNFLNRILIQEMQEVDQIYVAKNGKEALNKVHDFIALEEAEWPQLILLDINMPVMDGFEFLEEFSKYDALKRNKILIVLLTSSDSQKDIDKAKNYNIAGYLNKPLTEEKLQKVISSNFH